MEMVLTAWVSQTALTRAMHSDVGGGRGGGGGGGGATAPHSVFDMIAP